MLDQKAFRELFYDAVQIHRRESSVHDDRIKKAIDAIQEEYAPRNWNFYNSKPLNFSDPAFRCGYLHKYASLHASLVHYAAGRMGSTVFVRMFENVAIPKICCIGGGPGTEVFGLCALFCSLTEFSNKVFHFDIVDCMIGWKTAFASVLEASFKYGSFGSFMSCVASTYLEADMLSRITNRVQEAIRSADLVTMVKFVSAAASPETPRMLTNVFTTMKPGAAFLFIDSAGGEFYELVLDAANRCGFSSLCGPFRNMKYEHVAFRRKMFGTFGLSCATVAVQMWEKKFPLTLNAYESHLISEQLLDLKTGGISGCSSRNQSDPPKSNRNKNRRRHRSRSRNHCATSVSDNKKRSDSDERRVCSSAAQQCRKSQTEVTGFNRNFLNISDARNSQYLTSESVSYDIYVGGPKISKELSADCPITSSKTSTDYGAHRSSENYCNRQYSHSDESQRKSTINSPGMSQKTIVKTFSSKWLYLYVLLE